MARRLSAPPGPPQFIPKGLFLKLAQATNKHCLKIAQRSKIPIKNNIQNVLLLLNSLFNGCGVPNKLP